jgi:protein gp37
MGDKSAIEWTDATWNPVTGCVKVSQGCKNCYAKRDWPRLAGNKATIYAGRKFEDVRCHPERLKVPLLWARPRCIFVNSMSDLFQEDVPFEFIDHVFGVMSVCGQHTFQVLTKRPERALAYLTGDPPARHAAWHMCAVAQLLENDCATLEGSIEVHARNVVPGFPPRNVWIGTSVEDQATADARIPLLMQIPAAVRFLSVEPLLEAVDLAAYVWSRHMDEGVIERLHWIIVGGESGPRARPMASEWVRTLRDQAFAFGIPFFFKQWGEWVALDQAEALFASTSAHHVHVGAEGREEPVYRVGKKRAGRMLDGRTHDAMPDGL